MTPPVPLTPATPSLDLSALRSLLPDWADIQWPPTTGSTNADLLTRLRTAAPATPLLLGTQWQQAGRGRVSRPFHTDPEAALTFSCGFTARIPPAALPALSVMAGLAACEALAALLPDGHGLRVKWPNDLQWGEAKLAGILLETTRLPDTPDAVGIVVGIGVNLTGAEALSARLGRAVADWGMTGGPTDSATLVAAVARRWLHMVQACERAYAANRPAYADLPIRYSRFDVLAGRRVQVHDQGRIAFEGVADGPGADGRLRIWTSDGLQYATVGEISIRPAPMPAPVGAAIGVPS